MLGLNKEQIDAVQHPQHIPLQILAGPGSGKTKVLTSRIAHLVQHVGLKPNHICAVTFTNKAAYDMRLRLETMIGVKDTSMVTMGTFHSVCVKLLREYGLSIDVNRNFTICDTDESKKIIAKIIKESKFDSFALKESDIFAAISMAKSKGLSPSKVKKPHKSGNNDYKMIDLIYEEYTSVLERNNALDFDDLLLFGVKLLRNNKRSAAWCHHVLVDEFQDTNMVQYELMALLGSVYGCVTVVGDPDQSIYSWRSAEATNLTRMQNDFPGTVQILLEENYRSTGFILQMSLALISQDSSRIPKSLRTSHVAGIRPTLQRFSDQQTEADYIANEIQRLVAYTGGMLGWNDFVILLRFNALSREVESALQKRSIPSRILGGQKYFQRLEIKDILAYLQIVDNPTYTPAFNRAAQTPPRGLGEKSLIEMAARAKTLNISSMELAERIYIGTTPDIKPAVKRKLETLVKPILILRKMSIEGAATSQLIRCLVALINYEDYLKKLEDGQTRWENVQELINFATQFEQERDDTTKSSTMDVPSKYANREVINLAGDDDGEVATTSETPLQAFLQVSILSTDADGKSDEQATEKVTITTCHSSKGLEWPVVFIPGVEQSIFPFYKAEDDNEERRLLYVACTRAQGILYLSHAENRMSSGRVGSNPLSPFISAIPRSLFSLIPPIIMPKARKELSEFLQRTPVEDNIIKERIKAHTTEWGFRTKLLHNLSDGPSLHLDSHITPYASPPTDFVKPNTPYFKGVSQSLHSIHRSKQGDLASSELSEQRPPCSAPTRENNVHSMDREASIQCSSGIGGRTWAFATFPSPSVLQQPSMPSDSPTRQILQNSFSQDRQNLQSSVCLTRTSDQNGSNTSNHGIQSAQALTQQCDQPHACLASGKRRLGMGRPSVNGYQPKKRPKSS